MFLNFEEVAPNEFRNPKWKTEYPRRSSDSVTNIGGEA